MKTLITLAVRALPSVTILCAPLMSLAAPPSVPASFRYEVYSDSAAEIFWTRSIDLPARGYEVIRNGNTAIFGKNVQNLPVESV